MDPRPFNRIKLPGLYPPNEAAKAEFKSWRSLRDKTVG